MSGHTGRCPWTWIIPAGRPSKPSAPPSPQSYGGYYDFHGTSDEAEWRGADDHHDDLWCLLQQSATPDRYGDILRRARYYLGLWGQFWDEQLLT